MRRAPFSRAPLSHGYPLFFAPRARQIPAAHTSSVTLQKDGIRIVHVSLKNIGRIEINSVFGDLLKDGSVLLNKTNESKIMRKNLIGTKKTANNLTSLPPKQGIRNAQRSEKKKRNPAVMITSPIGDRIHDNIT